MDYDNKIKAANILMKELAQQLATNLSSFIENKGLEEKVVDKSNPHYNMSSVMLNSEQADAICHLVACIEVCINDFEYYTNFYPDKDKIWAQEIKEKNYIKNLINRLDLKNNLVESEDDESNN